MRKTVCAFTLCCFFFTSQAQFENKLADMGIKGNVKSVLEKEYHVTNYDYNNKKEERQAVFIFDNDGNKTEETYTAPSGDVLYHAVYTYSPDGDLIEEKTDNFEYNKRFVKKYTFESKSISVTIEYDSEAPLMLETYKLDSKNKVIQKIDYSADEIDRTINYTYSSAGLKLTETHQMSGTNVYFKYSYNNNGQLKTKTEVNVSGKALHTQSYMYDKKGNLLTETTSYADTPEKLKISYRYILDHAGNWTEKQEFMNENLFSVTTRELSYY
jgi:hypothetical protein